MTEYLILIGLLSVVIERVTEIPMNVVKWYFGEVSLNTTTGRNRKKDSSANKSTNPTSGQNLGQAGYRLLGFLIAAVFGLLTTGLADIDLFKAVFPSSELALSGNGWILTGFIIGLGSTPTHEVIKYIEEHKNKAKADRAALKV